MRKNIWLVCLLLIAVMPSAQAEPTKDDILLVQARGSTQNRTIHQENASVTRANAWTVGVAAGQLDGTFVRFAAELASVLNDGDNLRVIPMITYGAVGNINDLLFLKGTDIAITDADVFEEFKKNPKFRNIDRRIHYISELYNAEFHVLARKEITSLRDLQGKKVGFDTKGSAANLTGEIVFKRLGIKVEPVYINHSVVLEKMKTGEVAALVQPVGKPNVLFTSLRRKDGFHFLSVPYEEKLADYYLPMTLTANEYPELIDPGKEIETIGVPVVLAVYNWPKSSDRYRRVKRFIEYYFSRFETLKKSPYHPKWREINLRAKVPGWTRYSTAEELLGRMAEASESEASNVTTSVEKQIPDQRLFREFLKWKKARKQQ
jgi:TRAP transporter TAXI family solute receptor